MSIGRIIIAAALAAVAVPAGAAVTVLGSTSARMCFEAADSRISTSREGISYCDHARRGESVDLRHRGDLCESRHPQDADGRQ